MFDIEIEELFRLPKMKPHMHEENMKLNNEYEKKITKYFLDNYKKKPEIVKIFFTKYKFKHLIEVPDNEKAIQKILDNKVFMKLFLKNDLNFDSLIKILSIYNNCSDYYIKNIEKEEKGKEKMLKKIEFRFNEFISESQKLSDFKKWYMREIEKSIHNYINQLSSYDVVLGINNDNLKKIPENEDLYMYLCDLDKLFPKYLDNMKNMIKNKKSINSGEKNKQLNYFSRELINIFSYNFDKNIIIELVSILFGKTIDNTQLNNILENSNKHIANTNYSFQITVGATEEDTKIEYLKSRDALP